MSMSKLAWQNFRNGLKNYFSLILSLAFTILIFMNFQNIVYSDALAVIGEHNKDYSEIIVQTISVVLGVFMLFFTSYATNVFLIRRKKEIGIYVFMGLTNQKIGKLYAIEMSFVGALTLLIGIGLGILTTQLFQMLLLAMSDMTVEIGFQLSWQPVLITIVFFLAVYMIFVVKGYRNIIKSSVLSLVSASRQNEYVKQSSKALLFYTFFGLVILSSGYYMAIKEGGQEVMGNVLAAVLLVIIGVYMLFGGFVPMVFQKLAKRKTFLYHRERNLWINQIIFRMKKNYRTYAMVCVLMLCSVTALATGFAIKSRYKNIVNFRKVYTYQMISNRKEIGKKAQALIKKNQQIAYCTQATMLAVTDQRKDVKQKKNIAQTDEVYMVLPFSQIQKLAKDAGLQFDMKKPNQSQTVKARHSYLLSLLTKKQKITKQICGKEYEQVFDVDVPYLGYLQEDMDFYIVDDTEYERMRPYGQELYVYNYQITDTANYEASATALRQLAGNTKQNNTACIVTAQDSVEDDIGWVKILYSLCVFVVMVFLLASGSILFMKLYNDAFEEQERYKTLQKIGCSNRALKRSVSHELFVTYALPFLVMMVSSYFSVHALEKMMHENLTAIRFASIGIVFLICFICYRLSVSVYLKNAKIASKK